MQAWILLLGGFSKIEKIHFLILRKGINVEMLLFLSDNWILSEEL